MISYSHHSSSPSLPFPSRLRSSPKTPLVVFSSLMLQENLGHLKKNWRVLTGLNYWVVQEYYRLVHAVNSFKSQTHPLTNEQLTVKMDEFKRRLRQRETLEDLQAEAFAVVREAARRKLGMRHFDVQGTPPLPLPKRLRQLWRLYNEWARYEVA